MAGELDAGFRPDPPPGILPVQRQGAAHRPAGPGPSWAPGWAPGGLARGSPPSRTPAGEATSDGRRRRRRSTRGSTSGRSSAIKPGPARRPHSKCQRTAVPAADEGDIPRAIRPAQKPANTSPDPAVASQPAEPSAEDSIRSGSPSTGAIQETGPFSNTVHPARRAAVRAASPRRGSGVLSPDAVPRSTGSRSGNNRRNSPSCGVSRHLLWSSLDSPRAGSPAKAVSASASRIVAPPHSSATGSNSSARSTPSPGPRHRAFTRGSERNPARSDGESTTETITASNRAAFSGSAAPGHPTVTNPAPTLRAPRAANRPAPPCPTPPATTTIACPYRYLCPQNPLSTPQSYPNPQHPYHI